MPIDDKIRDGHKAAAIYELALTRLIVEFGITSNEAACILVSEAAKTLTPASVRAALSNGD